MKGRRSCEVCGIHAESSCTGCFNVFYCGVEHQKQGWTNHKKTCSKPYTVETDKVAGRVMVAARNMEPGDIILKEKAALVGPNIDSSSKPVCLGCFSSLEVKFVLCAVCSAPLCSPACKDKPLHKEECKILKQNPDALYSVIKNGTVIKRKKIPKNANFQIVLVLRGLLLKSLDVKKFKAVTSLQSHVEEREEMGKTQEVTEKILPIIQQYKIQTAYEDMIQSLCGIFDTNCFELFPSGAGDTVSGVFPAAAMMMHSCYKNTRLTFSDDHVLTLLARTKVKKGDRLYHTYARTFNPTNIRRIGLFSGKHFSCECVRCVDPTELGTYLSAVLCSCGGKVLADNPLDLTGSAACVCTSCKKKTPSLQIASQERNIMLEYQEIPRDDVVSLENFVEKFTNTLHPNHAFITEAKKQLSVAYGSYPGFTFPNLSQDRLLKKEAYCQHILELVSVLEPGISTQKGLTLYELWKAKQEIDLRKLKEKSLSLEDLRGRRIEHLKYLEESFRILDFEPRNSLHGQVAQEIAEKVAKEKTACKL